jgi:hypothetical protein
MTEKGSPGRNPARVAPYPSPRGKGRSRVQARLSRGGVIVGTLSLRRIVQRPPTPTPPLASSDLPTRGRFKKGAAKVVSRNPELRDDCALHPSRAASRHLSMTNPGERTLILTSPSWGGRRAASFRATAPLLERKARRVGGASRAAGTVHSGRHDGASRLTPHHSGFALACSPQGESGNECQSCAESSAGLSITDSPQPQALVWFGLLNTKPERMRSVR